MSRPVIPRFRSGLVRMLAIGLLLLAATGLLSFRYLDHGENSLRHYYDHLMLEENASGEAALTMQFFGVSTVLVDHGETALLTDGFFSRPSALEVVFTPIEPDERRIRRTLAEAGVQNLTAVIPLHTHYDHALDAGVVARITGAQLVGSESAANIGRGEGLPENRLRVVEGRESQSFGRFSIDFVPTRHIDHGLADGSIEDPLEPPAHALAYREGGNFTVIMKHPAGRILVNAGGFIPGALDDENVDVALIGIADAAHGGPEYRDQYWQNVVRATGARRVIPVHWDNFMRSTEDDLQPMPDWAVPIDQTMEALLERARADGIELRLLPDGRVVDPFAGLDETGQ